MKSKPPGRPPAAPPPARPLAPSPGLAPHLQHLAQARDKSLHVLAAYGDQEVFSGASLTLLFNCLFDRVLEARDDLDLPELATVLQRLCASLAQRQVLDLKVREDARREEEHRERLERLRSTLRADPDASRPGLDPALRAEIEAELNLL